VEPTSRGSWECSVRKQKRVALRTKSGESAFFVKREEALHGKAGKAHAKHAGQGAESYKSKDELWEENVYLFRK